MSAIYGNGYGSKHNWYIAGQPPMSVTHYSCRECPAIFSHYYNSVDDIFEAMKLEGVPENCPGAASERKQPCENGNNGDPCGLPDCDLCGGKFDVEPPDGMLLAKDSRVDV